MHDAVELVKALAWPCVVMYFILRFHKQILSLLSEMQGVVRRVHTAQGFGMQVELEKIGDELPVAEKQAQGLSQPVPPVPSLSQTLNTQGSGLDATF
jgi:hypothetical protein